MERNKFLVTVDAIVFTVMHDDLKVLLVKRKNDPFKDQYALPGGFLNENEELEDACKRELFEETNVKNIFLKELKTFGKVGRDPRGRIITIPFLALVDHNKLKLAASTDAIETKWYSMRKLPKLAFDHKSIIDYALYVLKFDLQTTNIAYQLLPDKFTLSSLQNLYEIVLGSELDKRNFRKKIKQLDILKGHNETIMEGAHRPAQLFSFNEKKYVTLKDKMNVFLK